MQGRGLPPPHPSLPAAPPRRDGSVPLHATSAPFTVTTAFAQPLFTQYQPPAYSSHYAQAYMQSGPAGFPATTAEGYTLSSTYEPSVRSSSTSSLYPNRHNLVDSRKPPASNFQFSAAWYQPGNSRCSYNGCGFTGSHKSVETHMMDRHLIYPPGWEKRPKKNDWDADPSLKGKPLPIQGTTLVLDSPEVLEAWIMERKKRWPTVSRVEDKKRKMEEAAARGQLSVGELNLYGTKRRRVDESSIGINHAGNDGGSHFSGRGRATDSGWGGRGRGRVATTLLREDLKGPHVSDSVSEDDDKPEVISSKVPPANAQYKIAGLGSPVLHNNHKENPIQEDSSKSSKPSHIHRTKRIKPHEPKAELHNPFAARPSLLRNLLLPEIRMTISNLSQAIRFLVDNDLLYGVELRPGEADGTLIEVINQSGTEAPEQAPSSELHGVQLVESSSI